jgi:putative pyruvate formate lyase activating enzyme
MTSRPGYVALYESGELEARVRRLEARLADCDLCPFACRVDRTRGKLGHCHTGVLAPVASLGAHHGEEPAISGSRGSGAIFFGNCNLRCRYCQNFQISQEPENQRGNRLEATALAEKMLSLQDGLRCHNINLVTPSHVVPQIMRGILEAVPRGLRLPLVYNTSGYDAVSTLKELDGVVDIYLADLRYADNDIGRKYSRARCYADRAREAIREMHRQVGDLAVDEEGVAVRGLIVRHLILPNGLAGSRESLTWLAKEVSPGVTVSIMSQYYPAHRARKYHELNRKITQAEYDEVVKIVDELGIENGWFQGMDAPESYLPDFKQEEPFSGGKRPRKRRR